MDRRLTVLIKNLFTRVRFEFWGPLRCDRHSGFYVSHSQFGEDMLLRVLLGQKRSGFYVDLGAHHPVYLSNTHRLYRHGWTGMNVDALPGTMELFRLLRPRDINVEACLGGSDGEEVTFQVHAEAALSNTTGVALSSSDECLKEVRMRTRSLGSLLKEHLADGQKIDFMSVDLEGADEAVLVGNDWSRYRPTFLLIEQHGPLRSALDSRFFQFLRDQGYEVLGKLGPSYLLGPP
jgi:FkbM family methyltransferase